MTKRLIALLAFVAVTLPLYADFGSMARAIDSQRGIRRVWIPFFGLARTLVRVADPQGVHDVQLAVFEGNGKLNAKQLGELMRQHVGKGFRPLVRAYSKKSGEWSFIYVKPTVKNRFELMILAADQGETVLVRVEVDAEVLARELDHPIEVGKMARR
ncbi:MAG TPA: hypothetical protein VGF48_25420 [Thermoanaerobaculia bacterium]